MLLHFMIIFLSPTHNLFYSSRVDVTYRGKCKDNSINWILFKSSYKRKKKERIIIKYFIYKNYSSKSLIARKSCNYLLIMLEEG